MKKGRLYFTVHHYDEDLVQLAKYDVGGYLYVNRTLDISTNMLDERPDIFADLYYRVKELEDIVYKK